MFVALEPVDLRLGFDRLAGFATERAGRSVRSAALFVFFGKRRTAVRRDPTDVEAKYAKFGRGVRRRPMLTATSVHGSSGSASLVCSARRIVATGLEEGLGRDDITQALEQGARAALVELAPFY